jgi:hypothetical protein
MNQPDYLESIKLHHCFVSFSSANQIFYISLWNGVLRDGHIHDIDIHFFEAKFPKIIDRALHFDQKIIHLSDIQLSFLSTYFTKN